MKRGLPLTLSFVAAISLRAQPQRISADPNDWPMYNHDPQGTRFNPAETRLGPDTVADLKLKWFYFTAGDVYATPVAADNTVYAGDVSGAFYALSSSGVLLWKTSLGAPVTASALVTDRMVFVGDQAGIIHALNRADGAEVWRQKPNMHPYAAIYDSPVWAGDAIVIGIASNEQDVAQAPNSTYPCCSFRGSVVKLDRADGHIIWQTYTISDADSARSASGAAVWSSPTYDAGLVYVSTGNNYAPPATGGSDAMIALDAGTGAIRWVHQFFSGDTAVGNVDYDFGDSPQVYTLASGRRVVGAGEKSGTYNVVDSLSGDLVGQTQAVPFCKGTEGLFADSAVAAGVAFVNGTNCNIFSQPPLIPPTGEVIALEGDASAKLWSFTSWFAPVLSGVAVANNVVYFESSGFVSFLYALDARTGRLLKSALLASGISGPAISRGQIYIGAGTTFASGFGTLKGIAAFGL